VRRTRGRGRRCCFGHERAAGRGAAAQGQGGWGLASHVLPNFSTVLCVSERLDLPIAIALQMAVSRGGWLIPLTVLQSLSSSSSSVVVSPTTPHLSGSPCCAPGSAACIDALCRIVQSRACYCYCAASKRHGNFLQSSLRITAPPRDAATAS
jgi:hypothetical protein